MQSNADDCSVEKGHREQNTVNPIVSSINESLARLSDTSIHISPECINIWDNGNEPSFEDVKTVYAPIHLKEEFKQLYRLLHPCLVDRTRKTNAGAFLQGTRGSGKTLCLNRCIRAFQDELAAKNVPLFRTVTLNGRVTPGDNVGVVVHEILRQLTSVPFCEKEKERDDKKSRSESIEEILRLKQVSFRNSLQLLNEILQLAELDSVPILFILDDLDAFLGSSRSNRQSDIFSSLAEHVGKERQVLLYHLLDRIASQGGYLCFVGVTSDLGMISRLEKRVLSRAEGASQFLLFGPPSSYENLCEILVQNCHQDLKGSVGRLLQEPAECAVHRQVIDTLQRDYRVGKDLRWFSRVLFFAMSLYRTDCISSAELPTFGPEYLQEALQHMGGSLLACSGERDIVLVGGCPSYLRIKAMMDMSGPQIALMLSARRILARDLHRENVTITLTLFRIIEEYRSYQGNSNRYSQPILRKAFRELMDIGLIRIASDYEGSSSFLYSNIGNFYDIDPNVLLQLPLHLTADVYRELRTAIEKNLLECSAALREWGRRMN